MNFKNLKFINDTDCNAEENPPRMHQTHQQKECTQKLWIEIQHEVHIIYFMKL